MPLNAPSLFEALLAVLGLFAVVVGILSRYITRRVYPLGVGEPTDPPGIETAWPTRRHFAYLALAFMAVAVYGSLVPFHYKACSFQEALRAFATIPYLSLGIRSRADWAANILLFIPIGFLWMGVFNVDRKIGAHWLWSSLIVTCGCVVFSLLLEFAQIWFPPRTASQNDILAQAIGGVFGAATWMVLGPAILQWLWCFTQPTHSYGRVAWLLNTYLIGLLIYSVLPLDLTISPAELYGKYKEGRITVIPFRDVSYDLEGVYGLMRDAVTFFPVGMWAATWIRPSSSQLRQTCLSLVLGMSTACFVEFLQVFVYSRYASTTDVVVNGFGVAIGAWVMRKWQVRDVIRYETENGKWLAGPAVLWCATTFAYTIVLLGIFCLPLNVIHDRSLLHARFDRFWSVPFETLYWGTEFNAVTQVLKRCVLFAILGSLITMTVESISTSRSARRILLGLSVLIVAGFGFAIEMAQVFLLPYIPDVTDVLLYVIGAIIGIVVTRRVREP